MTPLTEARTRAEAILAGTNYFEALGLHELGADVRALARITLELADDVEAERSARVAIQANRDECRAIIARQGTELEELRR
jgi:hypothetical protein